MRHKVTQVKITHVPYHSLEPATAASLPKGRNICGFGDPGILNSEYLSCKGKEHLNHVNTSFETMVGTIVPYKVFTTHKEKYKL